MVISRWKDSNVLQTVSTVMQKGGQVLKRQIGANLVDVRCSNDIVLYQQNMGGIDRGGDQPKWLVLALLIFSSPKNGSRKPSSV